MESLVKSIGKEFLIILVSVVIVGGLGCAGYAFYEDSRFENLVNKLPDTDQFGVRLAQKMGVPKSDLIKKMTALLETRENFVAETKKSTWEYEKGFAGLKSEAIESMDDNTTLGLSTTNKFVALTLLSKSDFDFLKCEDNDDCIAILKVDGQVLLSHWQIPESDNHFMPKAFVFFGSQELSVPELTTAISKAKSVTVEFSVSGIEKQTHIAVFNAAGLDLSKLN